jgi:leucyl-tRNA synthetase
MEFTNALYDTQHQPVSDAAFQEASDVLLLLLAPIAPFMAEEIWSLLGRPYSIHQQRWPCHDEILAADEVITLVLQVNGKVRGRLTMPADLNEDQARTVALENDAVRRHLSGKAPKKVIYVAGKLVNVVV